MTSVELSVSTETSGSQIAEAGDIPRPTPGAQGTPCDIRARAAHYERIANMTPDELVARLDPDFISSRLRKTALDIDNSELAERAGQQYDLISGITHDRQTSRDLQSIELMNLGSMSVFEVHGAIKWFDASKGYGFIVPDNGLPDVLLHVTALRAGGFDTAYEGARLRCEVLNRPKGMQVFRVLAMDESTAIHPSLLPQRTHATVEAVGGWRRAVVKWYNRVRGFGFLTLGSGPPDVFVHTDTLRRYGIVDLRPGQVVHVRLGRGAKGVMAAAIRAETAIGPKTQ